MISQPMESIWGFHILKWAPVNEDDMLAVLKKEFMDTQREQLYSVIFDKGAVKRMDGTQDY